MQQLNHCYRHSRITGKTGASVGLGQAMGIGLAEAGADVVCNCHFDGEADKTCREIEKIGRKTFPVSGDMSDKDVPKRLVEETIEKFGRIDILINNAEMIRRARRFFCHLRRAIICKIIFTVVDGGWMAR